MGRNFLFLKRLSRSVKFKHDGLEGADSLKKSSRAIPEIPRYDVGAVTRCYFFAVSNSNLGSRSSQGLQSLDRVLKWPGNRLASNTLGGRVVVRSQRDHGAVWVRRSYHVDRHGVQHFKKRGPSAWADNLTEKSFIYMGLAVGAGGVIYFYNLETVPYTHRKHLVLLSPGVERRFGDQGFKMLLKEYKNRVLPTNNPATARVHRISKEIIEALMAGTRASDWGQLETVADEFESLPGWDTVTRKSDNPLIGQHSHADHRGSEETLDEGWVDKSRKKGLKRGDEGYTRHLQGMEWQVVVVDDNTVNALCLPGGKIVVFTGLLKMFPSETDVATVIAHEVGHAVARHSAESLTQNIFLVAFELAVLSVFYVPSLVNSVSELLLRLPFSRRMEMEADHIGLILMAAAGYDPRLAPALYEKLASIQKEPEIAQYLSTHPSGKKRGEMLRSTGTMDEALSIYRQKMAGRGTEGFF